ncbi:uncharacterized protein VNE69_06125 [Vairimorpha necatrix]|uniref:Uncharacterized protein n=1 Tax=Vairimorpha necatrix TaxID=6039 RepID=A0AAX4JCW9_9MICR
MYKISSLLFILKNISANTCSVSEEDRNRSFLFGRSTTQKLQDQTFRDDTCPTGDRINEELLLNSTKENELGGMKSKLCGGTEPSQEESVKKASLMGFGESKKSELLGCGNAAPASEEEIKRANLCGISFSKSEDDKEKAKLLGSGNTAAASEEENVSSKLLGSGNTAAASEEENVSSKLLGSGNTAAASEEENWHYCTCIGR